MRGEGILETQFHLVRETFAVTIPDGEGVDDGRQPEIGLFRFGSDRGDERLTDGVPEDFLEEIGFLGNRIFRCRWRGEVVLCLLIQLFLLHSQWDGAQGVHCRLAFCPEDAVGQFCLAVVH